jgi:hypothetical protein
MSLHSQISKQRSSVLPCPSTHLSHALAKVKAGVHRYHRAALEPIVNALSSLGGQAIADGLTSRLGSGQVGSDYVHSLIQPPPWHISFWLNRDVSKEPSKHMQRGVVGWRKATIRRGKGGRR